MLPYCVCELRGDVGAVAGVAHTDEDKVLAGSDADELPIFADGGKHIGWGGRANGAWNRDLQIGEEVARLAIEPGKVAIAVVERLRWVRHVVEIAGISEDWIAIPVATGEQEQAEARHATGLADEEIVVAALEKGTRHARWDFDLLVDVGVERHARRRLDHAVEQGVHARVVGPACARIGEVGQAGGQGAIGVTSRQFIEARGHGELMAEGDFLLLRQGCRGPACADVVAGRVSDVQVAFLLRDADREARQGLACRSPIPKTVGGKSPKILLQHDFPVLEDNECLGIFALEIGVQAVDLRLAPTEATGLDRVPCAADAGREIQTLSADCERECEQNGEE